ncbi:PIN domain-containing protein [Gordonia insulae]|uniref:NTP pyrophosphohydrolase n=1 Tax=Gordonia insulae TaxID=2420509 RepID=A0A3G8JI28_9ACTN|nr:hypothetical protein [Gordonia insulae]AZG44694.1 hypothetical protein D7316_01280 [Gordonia insulae]
MTPDIPLIIVDAANVVGSVPDGWWRDRRGATERLRDQRSGLHAEGIDGVGGPVEVVMIVEGRARGVSSSPTVSTIAATGSGDDRIVEVVAAHPGRRRIVVTADRELRRRVRESGAEVAGPSTVRRH